jgi:hypothetical protein
MKQSAQRDTIHGMVAVWLLSLTRPNPSILKSLMLFLAALVTVIGSTYLLQALEVDTCIRQLARPYVTLPPWN